jgi:HEAT repeat protein
MGVFDLFKREGRQNRARDRNIKSAVDKYKQSPDRLKALQALRDDGSVDALYGLMRRFGMMYDKTIEDEQEKEWVFEVLVEKGETVLPALKKYLFSAESISWPLRLLDKVANHEQEIDVITEVLARHEPGYERDPTKKIQLLNHLAAFKDARVPPLLVPYLGDMDEGVRYAAVEALTRQGNEDIAREPLLQQLVSESEESLRIRIQIADGFADLGWRVHGYREAAEKRLPEQFQLDRDGHVKKKPQAKE